MKRKRKLTKGGLDLPDYTHFLPRRSKTGGNVTPELVAKLVGCDSENRATASARVAPLGPLDPRPREGDDRE